MVLNIHRDASASSFTFASSGPGVRTECLSVRVLSSLRARAMQQAKVGGCGSVSKKKVRGDSLSFCRPNEENLGRIQ